MAPDKTVTAEWVGEDGFENWSGYDHGDDSVPVTLNPGDPVEISPELAAHLGEHFGHLVNLDGKPAKSKPARKKKNEDA